MKQNDEKRFQRIVLCVDDYDGDKDKLFNAVGKQLQILLDSHYITVVHYDEPSLGVIIIDFEHDETFDPWGCANPVWITEEENFYLDSIEDEEENE